MTFAEFMEVSANDNRQVTVKDETGQVISKFVDQYHVSLNDTILAYPVASFTLNVQNGIEVTVNTSSVTPTPDPEP